MTISRAEICYKFILENNLFIEHSTISRYPGKKMMNKKWYRRTKILRDEPQNRKS